VWKEGIGDVGAKFGVHNRVHSFVKIKITPTKFFASKFVCRADMRLAPAQILCHALMGWEHQGKVQRF